MLFQAVVDGESLMDVLFQNLTDDEREAVIGKAKEIARMNIGYYEGADPSKYESAKKLDCSGFFRVVYNEAVDPDEYVVKGRTQTARTLFESLEPAGSPKPGDLACYSRVNGDGEIRWHVMLVTGSGVIGACDELGKVGTHSVVDYSSRWNFKGYRKFPGKSIDSDDALFKLGVLRSFIDCLCDTLRKADPGWESCFNCPNSGKCCSFGPENDQTITEPEWRALEKYLRTDHGTRDYARERIENGKYCLFHDRSSDKCLVYDERPLICRLVPFLAYENAGKIMYWNPGPDCSTIDKRLEIKSGWGSMKATGQRFIVEIEGHFRIRAKELDFILAFCRSYKKRGVDG